MKPKSIAIVLTGLCFFISGISSGYKQDRDTLPSLAKQLDEVLRLFSIIQIADIQGLDTLTCCSKLIDSTTSVEIIRQIREKRIYLADELVIWERALEELRVQQLIQTATSVEMLENIKPDIELLSSSSYADIETQIFCKKQIIEMHEMESAIKIFRFFGKTHYLPENKTLEENLPDWYFIGRETAEEELIFLNEKLFRKIETIREMQQVLGEILFAQSVQQVRKTKVPRNILDKNLRSELNRNFPIAVKSLADDIQVEVIWHLADSFLVLIDSCNLNASTRAGLLSEVEWRKNLYRKIVLSDLEMAMYTMLAEAENPSEIPIKIPDSLLRNISNPTEFIKSMDVKIALLNEHEYYRRTDAELCRINQILRNAVNDASLVDLRIDTTLLNDTIVKILREKIAYKRLLLQHNAYINNMTETRTEFVGFLSELRKIFTFKALDEFEITCTTRHTIQAGQIKICLYSKGRYFESQQRRSKLIEALRSGNNEWKKYL